MPAPLFDALTDPDLARDLGSRDSVSPSVSASVSASVSPSVSPSVSASVSASFSGSVSDSVTPPLPPRALVDFSSPNIAKEMHVGHLRSTIIGDTLCRVLEYCGYHVLRINHVGDWGTPFGMLIAHLKEVRPQFAHDPPTIRELQQLYKDAKRRFDEDEAFQQRAYHDVVALQQLREQSSIDAWQLICHISRVEFQKIYDRLGVLLEERGESSYQALLPSVVRELTELQLCKQVDGAHCVFSPSPTHTFPLILQKSDGGYTYDTTDMAAVRYRTREQAASWVIYVTDAGQRPHFDLVFETAVRAGWVDPSRHRLTHVGFGVVTGKDGKRIKTRSGDSVRLADLLDEAKERSAVILRERAVQQREEGGESALDAATLASIDEASQRIGYAAVKYADLSRHRTMSYAFDFDSMLDMKGDTAVYLLYTYARIRSVLNKTESGARATDAALVDAVQSADIVLEHVTERALALHLIAYHDVIVHVMRDLCPHHLCSYAFTLCNAFNEFYRDCRIAQHEREQSRRALCIVTQQVLAHAFHLLAIQPVESI